MLKPILLILTSLSIIWDFGVFAQPYLLIGASHVDKTNYLMGVYVFIKGYGDARLRPGRGDLAADAVDGRHLSVLYVRQMLNEQRQMSSAVAAPRGSAAAGRAGSAGTCSRSRSSW